MAFEITVCPAEIAGAFKPAQDMPPGSVMVSYDDEQIEPMPPNASWRMFGLEEITS